MSATYRTKTIQVPAEPRHHRIDRVRSQLHQLVDQYCDELNHVAYDYTPIIAGDGELFLGVKVDPILMASPPRDRNEGDVV